MAIVINTKLMRMLLAERGWRMSHLALATGLHVNSLRRLMYGGPFKSTTLALISEALECEPHQLIEVRGKRGQIYGGVF